MEQERREVRPPEVRDEMIPGLVIRDELRDAQALAERGARRDPAAPGVRLLRGVDDTQNGPAPLQNQAKVPAPPDVSGKDFDFGRLVPGSPRELREASERGKSVECRE